MSQLQTNTDILAELCKSKPDSVCNQQDLSHDFEDNSNGEGEINFIEEDDVLPDIFSPDTSVHTSFS